MACFDFLIVGSGLFGATVAHKLMESGKSCLVVEKRDHIGGNAYTRDLDGIYVHEYGAHIFHTESEELWRFVTSLVPFDNFINSPIANYKGRLFNLPFNMNTFFQMWGCKTPAEAQKIIESQRKELCLSEPQNLEQQAITLVGKDIYELLIKGYTEKQWGRECRELPPSIIRRLPVRYTFNNNYFNDRFQGIPTDGYTKLIEKLLDGAEIRLKTDFIKNREELLRVADKVIYTGQIDEFYNYCFGPLEYRRVSFRQEIFNTNNYQGVAVINYTDRETPYTRSIEHRHFMSRCDSDRTVVSFEYPEAWSMGMEPYYPIDDIKNSILFEKYQSLSKKDSGRIYFGGRLGSYKYFNMDQVMIGAINLTRAILSKEV